MKIKIEIPDSTKCVAINLVFEDGWKMMMAASMFDTTFLKDGAEFKVPSKKDREKS